MQIGTNLQTISANYINITKNKEDSTTQNNSPKNNPSTLSVEELTAISKLQARDTEVRSHEMAHQSAGGGLTGGASYTYQKGPDGKMYAIGGEVSISMPKGDDPKELKAQARQVIAAAMAPANPSSQDFAVASNARAIEIKAQQEETREMTKELIGKKEYNSIENYSQTDEDISIDISA